MIVQILDGYKHSGYISIVNKQMQLQVPVLRKRNSAMCIAPHKIGRNLPGQESSRHSSQHLGSQHQPTNP